MPHQTGNQLVVWRHYCDVEPMTLSDAQLVALAREGDRLACAELFERHRGIALSICRRALAPTELIDDALQEAALQTLLSLGGLKQPDRFGAWYAGITMHVCHRLLRTHCEFGLVARRVGRRTQHARADR